MATTSLHRRLAMRVRSVVPNASCLASQRFCHIFGFHAGDVVPVENDFSGITPVQTGYGAEQRRFSCPVSSDKGCQLTFFYRGIYLVEQLVFFVTYGKML